MSKYNVLSIHNFQRFEEASPTASPIKALWESARDNAHGDSPYCKIINRFQVMQDTDTTGRDLIRNNDQFAVHYRSYYTANNLRNQLFDLKLIPFFLNKK